MGRSYKLRQFHTPPPRRCKISIVSRHPQRLAKYEAATIAGLNVLEMTSPMLYSADIAGGDGGVKWLIDQVMFAKYEVG